MNPINLGGGTVLFENAIDIPQESLISYLEKEKDKWRAENFDIVYVDQPTERVHARYYVCGASSRFRPWFPGFSVRCYDHIS